MFRLATQADFPAILAIYNQVIESRIVTADLVPATEESRRAWFDFHLASKKYPIWVLEQAGEVVGWCSYSQFYSRSAYDGTAEISFYVDNKQHGKGLGKACIEFLKAEMPNHQLHTLLAFVFGNNTPSIHALQKNGFTPWGNLPRVADMQSHFEDLVILGYQQAV